MDGMAEREGELAGVEVMRAKGPADLVRINEGRINIATQTELIRRVVDDARFHRSGSVFTLNLDHLVKLREDARFRTAYDAATGKQLYHQRALPSGSYYASPVAAGGNIYFASLADGAVTVLKAGVDRVEVVAENSPLNERVAATPAIADNVMYIRTAESLYAFANEP